MAVDKGSGDQFTKMYSKSVKRATHQDQMTRPVTLIQKHQPHCDSRGKGREWWKTFVFSWNINKPFGVVYCCGWRTAAPSWIPDRHVCFYLLQMFKCLYMFTWGVYVCVYCIFSRAPMTHREATLLFLVWLWELWTLIRNTCTYNKSLLLQYIAFTVIVINLFSKWINSAIHKQVQLYIAHVT